jgi:excinuclease ABC subunit A
MMQSDFSSLEPKKFILIKGAQLHNLKNIDVAIPRNQMVVITGLSGSGKSSLAFDTLYAEGQRRYVESLSSYARQFLGKLDKPKVEYIKGIAPAIAIEQKVNTTNARSTVGTSTEIYDYLKLLFARIGKTYSPISGEEVKKQTVSDVVKHIQSLKMDSKWLLLAPIHLEKGRKLHDKLKVLLQQGFARVLIDNQTVRLDDFVATLEMIDELNSTKLTQTELSQFSNIHSGFTPEIVISELSLIYQGQDVPALSGIDLGVRSESTGTLFIEIIAIEVTTDAFLSPVLSVTSQVTVRDE